MTHNGLDPSDLELVEEFRRGRRQAVVDLWTRHYPAALSEARASARHRHDAETLASNAFTRMLSDISRGSTPTVSMHDYLAELVQDGAADSRSGPVPAAGPLSVDDPASEPVQPAGSRNAAVQVGDPRLVREAFAGLTRRWQVVLWKTAVDRDSNKAVGRAVGLSTNGVGALARRARRALMGAYLRAHVSLHGVSPGCEPFVPHLADFNVRPTRATADLKAPLRAHVALCAECTDRLSELRMMERRLGDVLAPAILGLVRTETSPAAAGAGLASHATSTPTVWRVRSSRWSRPMACLAGVAGLLVAGVVVAVLGVPLNPPTPGVAGPRSHSTSLRTPAGVMLTVPSRSAATHATQGRATAAIPAVRPTRPTPIRPTTTQSNQTRPTAKRSDAARSSRPSGPAPSQASTSASIPASSSRPTTSYTPVIVSLELGGDRSDTSATVTARAQGIVGFLSLTIEVPEGVALLSAVGDWEGCRQSLGVITCHTRDAGADEWKGTIHTVWRPGVHGGVTASVAGTYANGSAARGGVGTSWP